MKKIGKLKTFKSSEIKDSYISIGFECLDRELFKAEKCYEPLGKTGVKYARCQTGWCRCEKEKGVYDFKWLDDVVDNLLANGVQPWFNVGYGNPIYMDDIKGPAAVGCVPIYYGEETEQAWYNYVTALTNHFKDRITHYEIWNEADIRSFWYPKKPDGAELAYLIDNTAKIIKDVQPDAKTGTCISQLRNYKYIDTFLSNVNSEYLDFFAVHSYSAVPEICFREGIAFVRETLDKYGHLKTEVWQGEGGYPSWAYEGHHIVPKGCDDERPQAVWMLRRYFIDVSIGIKRSSFFQMADMWEKPYEKASEMLKKPAGHGILKGITYETKQSYDTITNLSAIFTTDVKPAKYYMQIRNIENATSIDLVATQTFMYEKNGLPIFAYYLPSPIALHNPTRSSLIRIAYDLQNPVIIDPYTAEVLLLEAEDCDIQGNRVLFDYTLPMKDYPLILTEREAFEIIED